MLKKIQIFSGTSQYDIFAHWQLKLKAGFEACGVPAEVVPIQQELIEPPCDEQVSIAFNLVRNWDCPEREKRRHIAWSVDHPVFNYLFFTQRFRDPTFGGSTQMLFVDRARCQLAANVLDLPNPVFLPHAATAPFVDVTDWNRRPYELVFFGSLSSLQECERNVLNAAGQVGPEAVALVRQIMDGYQFESADPSDLIFWNLIQRVAAGDPQRLKLMFMFLFQPLDIYLRCRHRIRFFSALQSRPIHIFGNGPWEQVALHPDSVLHGPVDHEQIPEIMQQSKVVINHGPTLRDGAHERIFDALASGCSVLTTPSGWLTEQFSENLGVLACPAGEEPQMGELIATHLSADRRSDILRGQLRVRHAHTMEQRAEQILQIIEKRWDLRRPKEKQRGLACAE